MYSSINFLLKQLVLHEHNILGQQFCFFSPERFLDLRLCLCSSNGFEMNDVTSRVSVH